MLAAIWHWIQHFWAALIALLASGGGVFVAGTLKQASKPREEEPAGEPPATADEAAPREPTVTAEPPPSRSTRVTQGIRIKPPAVEIDEPWVDELVAPEAAAPADFGPAPAFERPRPIAPELRGVEIFFGTDRAPDGRWTYSKKRGRELRFGRAMVTAPRRRRPGKVQRPFSLFGFELQEQDPQKHFVVQAVRQLTANEFRHELALENAKTGDQPALLFVHGYNVTFRGGLYRTAQLALDLEVKGLVLHYSWPSAGRFLGYDRDMETAKQSAAHLRAFLDVLAQTGIKRINILAHSKGSELLLMALDGQAASRLKGVRQVVLASPDVDSDFARQQIERIHRKVKGLTLYACAADLALLASRLKAGGEARAGGLLADGYPLIAEGLDSIDATRCTLRLDEFNHNAFVADTVLRHDLAALLATGRRPPNQRSASITPRTCRRGDYWYLEPR